MSDQHTINGAAAIATHRSPDTSYEHAAPPIEGAALLDRLASILGRYIVFPSPAERQVLALWIVHTHAIEYASATPYIAIHSPAPRCGKSTLLELLTCLTRNALGGSNITPASIYRMIDAHEPTLVLDEMDSQTSADRDKAAAVQSIINSGYRRGEMSKVWRADPPSLTPVGYSTFCPKAFAAIAMRWMHASTRDRVIAILLERKLPTDPVEAFRHRRFEAEAQELRELICAWVAQNEGALSAAEPEMPVELDDRKQEIWEPLLAIADLAGSAWQQQARSAALYLHAGPDYDDLPLGVLLLRDLRAVFDQYREDKTGSAELCQRLNEIEESPWSGFTTNTMRRGITPRALARQLKPFGICPGTLRFPEIAGLKPTRKGYERAWFENAWNRYLTDDTAEDVA